MEDTIKQNKYLREKYISLSIISVQFFIINQKNAPSYAAKHFTAILGAFLLTLLFNIIH